MPFIVTLQIAEGPERGDLAATGNDTGKLGESSDHGEQANGCRRCKKNVRPCRGGGARPVPA